VCLRYFWVCVGPDSAASGGSSSSAGGGGGGGGGNGRVSTPTATESVLPWKRDDDSGELSGPVKQCEFPAWCTNKEYLAYSSPSATFLGKTAQISRTLYSLFYCPLIR